MIGAWLRRRQQHRRARQAMLALFDDPSRLAGTSLRPEHRARVNLQEFDADGSEIVAVRFTIIRHPRPYAFSRQYHEVAQLYQWCPGIGELRHIKSVNLTRQRGGDGETHGLP